MRNSTAGDAHAVKPQAAVKSPAPSLRALSNLKVTSALQAGTRQFAHHGLCLAVRAVPLSPVSA